jgi:Domain of unknown function (DUF4397)
MHRRTRVPVVARLALVALVAAALLGPSVPAGAQQGEALARIGHFSRVTGAADVYVDGERRFGPVPFRAISDYLRLDPGAHEFAIRAAGAAADAEPLAATTVDLAAGEASTVAVVGAKGRLRFFTAKDDLSPPPAGMAKVRGMHVSPEAPAIDVRTAGGPMLFRKLTFPSASRYVTIPPGEYEVEMLASGTDRVLVRVGGLRVPAGGVFTVVGAGNARDDIATFPVVDAIGAGTLPKGGVGTGAGGTAPGGAGRTAVWLVIALLLVAAGGGLLRRRLAGS